MNDIHCGKCGEPWNLYVLNQGLEDIIDPSDPDVPEKPGEYVKNGKGCPTCDWGETTDVSRGQSKDEEELQAERMRDLMQGDEDPAKYF